MVDPTDHLFITPPARRRAMLDVIAGARERLVLSLFRCDDHGVVEALAAAVKRGVSVEAILTNRAKGGRKRLQALWTTLDRMGATVHWYHDPIAKYHAKYLVADERVAMVATLNPSVKCFTQTWDFVLMTTDRALVRSLGTLFSIDAAGESLQARHRLSDRLLVAPESGRPALQRLIAGARRRIDILDHKLSDPDVVALLRERRAAGVEVSVIGGQVVGGLLPHGKLAVIDGARAILGSMAMSTLSLDFRREVSVVIDDPMLVSDLDALCTELRTEMGPAANRLPGDQVRSVR